MSLRRLLTLVDGVLLSTRMDFESLSLTPLRSDADWFMKVDRAAARDVIHLRHRRGLSG